MKNRMIFPLIVLFLQGCDKPEEKHPSVSPTPKPADRLKPVGTQSPGERRTTVSPEETAARPGPTPPAPPSTQEVAEFEKAVETLTKKAEPLLNKTTGAATLDTTTIQLECNQLLARRAQLIAGMDLEQKKEFAKKSFGVVQVRNALLQLETEKNPPPNDIPGVEGAVPPPPAPPDAAPPPPQP